LAHLCARFGICHDRFFHVFTPVTPTTSGHPFAQAIAVNDTFIPTITNTIPAGIAIVGDTGIADDAQAPEFLAD
jgi:hypothetical protein